MRSQHVTLALGAVAALACSACILGNVAFSPDDTRVAAVFLDKDLRGKSDSQLWVTDVATLDSKMVIADEGLGALDGLLLPVESALAHWPGVNLNGDAAFYVRT